VAARTTYPEDGALSLSMAIVVSSPGPLLLLDGDLTVIAASTSFSAAFDIDVASTPGNLLFRLGDGEWDTPQLRSLLEATASGAAKIEAYEMDLMRPGQGTRNLIIHAQRLVYQDAENPRLLIAVTDVTDALADAKEKEDALRRNLILLQEVRHRVANSLQIIASVLLQNARKTASDETRGHLKDAHQRVMSVAELERQLAGSGEPHVELRAYFSSLCTSIAASMIADRKQISLVVEGAPGVVDARVSMSLGLIVTELVINALKHAFPDHRRGVISVAFEVHGPNWVLSVADDGVGMPTDPAQMRTGLGTSIVEALARQLAATVEITAASPGTRVTINHTQVALVADGQPPATAERRAADPAAQAR